MFHGFIVIHGYIHLCEQLACWLLVGLWMSGRLGCSLFIWNLYILRKLCNGIGADKAVRVSCLQELYTQAQKSLSQKVKVELHGFVSI